MSVYTRAGDKGKTRLYQGKTISKASLRIEAVGSVDELNSSIGVALSEIRGQKSEVRKELTQIQNDLFEIGASLANPHSTRASTELSRMSSGQASSIKVKFEQRVKEFEKIIDKLENDLPPLYNFILPGGGRTGSKLHLARTVSRRAERSIVALSEQDKVSREAGSRFAGQEEIIKYMNRLSDLLFMFARFINNIEKKKEIVWKNR